MEKASSTKECVCEFREIRRAEYGFYLTCGGGGGSVKIYFGMQERGMSK